MVEEVSILRVEDTIDDSRLEVHEDRAGNVMLIIRLVEEHILAIRSVHCKWLENAFRIDAVLCGKLLPKLMTDLVAALANLQGDDLARHFVLFES